MKKKGLSEVISIVLIILLAIASVVILWTFIKGTIEQSASGIETVQFTSRFKILEIFNNPRGDGSIFTVKVLRESGKGTLSAINFIVERDDEEVKTFRKDIDEGDLDELESKVYEISYGDLGAGFDFTNIKKVSIAPVFKTNSGEIQGNIVDSSTDIKSGACTDGEKRACIGDGNVCKIFEETCVIDTWICEEVGINEGISCDDGDGEVCTAGKCDASGSCIPEHISGSCGTGGFCSAGSCAGPVAFWPFEGAEPQKDVVNNILEAIVAGGASITSEMAIFDGLDGSRLLVLNDPIFNFATPLDHTISFWFKADIPQIESGAIRLIDKFKSTGGFYIGLEDNNIRFKEVVSSGSLSIQTTTEYVDDNWHHVAVVVDAGTSGSFAKMYIDNSPPLSHNLVGLPVDSNANFGIGANHNNINNNNFKGSIDNIRIYHDALLPEAISDIFEAECVDHPNSAVTCP